MAHLIPFGGKQPQIAEGAFVAPTAVLIGDVVVHAGSSIWFGAVLRADFAQILIGPGTNIQDNCVLHTADHLPTIVGTNVTVGHLCMLEGCVVEDGALIGMNSTLLNRVHIGAGSVIAAGSVVREGVHIPPNVLAAGVPAQIKRALSDELRARTVYAAQEYQRLRLRYMEA